MDDQIWIWLVFFVLAPSIAAFKLRLRLPKWFRIGFAIFIVVLFFALLLFLGFG